MYFLVILDDISSAFQMRDGCVEKSKWRCNKKLQYLLRPSSRLTELLSLISLASQKRVIHEEDGA